MPAPVLALLAVAGIGLGLGYALTRGDHSTAPPPVRVSTSLRTVTGPAQTIVRTVVTTAPAPAPASTSAPPSASTGGDPYAENNRAWALMQQGNYASALPLLRDAVQQLNGRQDLGTAYANYNLGDTLLQLGRCREALPYLQAAKSIEPARPEVRDAIQQAEHC